MASSYGGSISNEDSTNSYFSSEAGEGRSVSAKEEVREKLRQDVEDFINAGGHIEEAAMGVSSDPPKKPESNYGRRPI